MAPSGAAEAPPPRDADRSGLLLPLGQELVPAGHLAGSAPDTARAASRPIAGHRWTWRIQISSRFAVFGRHKNAAISLGRAGVSPAEDRTTRLRSAAAGRHPQPAAEDEQGMDATYRFEEPRTAILRRTLLGRPRSPGAVADLLFLEAWEAQLAGGIAAILRARQIRRANPALAVGIRGELARVRPLVPAASRRRMPDGETEHRTEPDRGAAKTSPRVAPNAGPQQRAPAEDDPVSPEFSDARRAPVSGACGGERGSTPGRARGR